MLAVRARLTMQASERVVDSGHAARTQRSNTEWCQPFLKRPAQKAEPLLNLATGGRSGAGLRGVGRLPGPTPRPWTRSDSSQAIVASAVTCREW